MMSLGLWSTWGGTETSEYELAFIESTYTRTDKPVPTFMHGWDLIYPYVNSDLPFSNSDLVNIELAYKSLNNDIFSGILFLGEERYRKCVGITEPLTWFNESLTPQGTMDIDAWQREMYFRMVRGFCNYYHSLGKTVGITMGDGVQGNLDLFYGASAYNFILANFDFVIVYSYTKNLADYPRFQSYLSFIDAELQNMDKYAILTRPWTANDQYFWDREARALEMHQYLKRGIAVTTYPEDFLYPYYKFAEAWADMKACRDLYNSNAPYYDYNVVGTNMLTGKTGQTYGYVSDVAPPSVAGIILPVALGATAYYIYSRRKKQ